jgi:hypothetical protein
MASVSRSIYTSGLTSTATPNIVPPLSILGLPHRRCRDRRKGHLPNRTPPERHGLGTAFRRNFADFSDRLQDSRPRKKQTVDRPSPYRTRALFAPTTADVGSLSQLPALGRERAQAWIDHHLDDLGSRTLTSFPQVSNREAGDDPCNQ